MTKEDFSVDSNNMFILVIAVYTDYKSKGKTFPYSNLLSQVETYKMNGTTFKPKFHKIGDFMVDAYTVYDRYLSIEDKLTDMLSMTGLGEVFNEEKIKEELMAISNTFEVLMINCDFEGVQIRGIQKNFLKDKLEEAIEIEEYELCAVLKKKIDNI